MFDFDDMLNDVIDLAATDIEFSPRDLEAVLLEYGYEIRSIDYFPTEDT